jgi:hypothetical protein
MTETANYGERPTSREGVVPSDVENFFDKYSKGMRIVVEGAQADTGQTPKETIWTKNKASSTTTPPTPRSGIRCRS